MLYATEYLGKVGIGVTIPEFYRANDGHIYIVKRSNNRLGTKVLINEFIAAELGKRLELIFPPAALIRLDDFLTDAYAAGQPHFASRYIADCQYADATNINLAANIPAMAGVILFDHFFHNNDRCLNRKNLLLKPDGNSAQIYAIDNSHLFKSGRWHTANLNGQITQLKRYKTNIYALLLANYLSAADFASYYERFCQLTSDDITAILDAIPSQWLDDDAIKPAISEFCRRRLELLPQIAAAIMRGDN